MLARRFTPHQTWRAQQALWHLRVPESEHASHIDIIEAVALAFNMWRFPEQDDIDFALPNYDLPGADHLR